MYSLLIKNGLVVDGTGKPGQVLDIACEGNQIVNIDSRIDSAARVVIEAQGKVVAPGFIDIQNHSDSYWQLFDNPGLDSLASQGFTTILVGNCGASLAPILSNNSLLAMQKWHDLEGVNTNWRSFAELADVMEQRQFGCNVASLVGYSTLRRGLVGDQVRSLDKEELSIVYKNLVESLEAGAFGLSTGLAYSHELMINELELSEMAKAVADRNGLMSVHLRNESADVLKSIEEVLDIARHTGVNLKISHFKFKGVDKEKNFKAALDLLEMEHHKGLNVHFDVYPYDTVWQVLFSYLPNWAMEGGRSFWTKQLSDPLQKSKILNYLSEAHEGFQDMVISSTSNKLNVVGKKLSEIAKNLGISVEEAILEIIQKGGSEVMVFDRSLEESQVKQLALHPLAIISTDGGGFSLPLPGQSPLSASQNKLVHPRCFGTAPKFIKENLVSKSLSLHESIWKLTGLPAKKIGMQKRGTLAIGSFADIVIFDQEKIDTKTTLVNPYQFPSGIEYVFVNGEASVAESQPTGRKSGWFLKNNK